MSAHKNDSHGPGQARKPAEKPDKGQEQEMSEAQPSDPVPAPAPAPATPAKKKPVEDPRYPGK